MWQRLPFDFVNILSYDFEQLIPLIERMRARLSPLRVVNNTPLSSFNVRFIVMLV